MSQDENLTQFEIYRMEYEGDTVGDTGLYPNEIRYIIAQRRMMEERIGTNGSIKLTLKLSSSVHDLLSELDSFQEQQAASDEEEEEEEPVDEDPEDEPAEE